MIYPRRAHLVDDHLRPGNDLRRRETAGDVVGAFEENDVRGAFAIKHVPMYTLQRRWAVAAIQDTIPCNACIATALRCSFGPRARRCASTSPQR